MFSKGKRIFLILIVLAILLFSIYPRERGGFISKRVTIPRGADATMIARILEEEGVIRSRLWFLVLVNLRGATDDLKAGEYLLNSKMSTIEIIKRLVKGEVVLYKITIPEGYTTKQIASLLEREGFVDGERFLRLCRDPALFRSTYPVEAESLEGYLFPDTYHLSMGLREEEIIRIMLRRFKRKVVHEGKWGAQDFGVSLHEAIILASMIEHEAAVPEERPLISAVFWNRLRRGLPLQSCATVQYALGRHKSRLSYNDLRTPSPYNTYLHPGLPPGPICNPGMASIKAALNPADVDYLYFVSNNDGTHTFSTTLRHHIRAKRKK
jgi:UPF0755 protein